MPKISICLPNLNNRRFLQERLETIFRQTFQDWEIIVVDNFSDDGAWEFFVEQEKKEPRMRISQAPREGMYANWNNCIRMAKGEFVYVATSDDTMPPDCLEKLVAALEQHPECDLAHCPLRKINENGQPIDTQWWATRSIFALSSPTLLTASHVRKAPFDGLLHLGGESVYISITQLLIRRSLFNRIGMFEGRWGSAGDFNWNMRASLVANTAHVPDTWGGWRLHPSQATQQAGGGTLAYRQKIEEMIDHALENTRGKVPADINTLLQNGRRDYFRKRWEFEHAFQERSNLASRIAYLLREMVSGSAMAWCYFGRRISGVRGWPDPPIEVVRQWWDSWNFPPCLITE